MDLFFRGSHTTNFVTCGFNRSYNQAADVPSSKVTCKTPRRPSINCRIMLAFVSMTHSITTLPTEFLTAAEILSLCTSIPIYLMLVVIKGVLSGRVEPNTQNLLQGAPFYIASACVYRRGGAYQNMRHIDLLLIYLPISRFLSMGCEWPFCLSALYTTAGGTMLKKDF